MTARATTTNHAGLNAMVNWKALLSLLLSIAVVAGSVILWIVDASVEPVKQHAINNSERIERQDNRLEKRFDRVEAKLDELLKR